MWNIFLLVVVEGVTIVTSLIVKSSENLKTLYLGVSKTNNKYYEVATCLRTSNPKKFLDKEILQTEEI